MTVERKGNNLVITLAIDDEPKTSSSGKTKVVASSRGNQPVALEVGNKNEVVFIGVNAYMK